MNESHQIAGDFTIEQWKELSKKLRDANVDDEIWKKAYRDVLFKRLQLRYLDPIGKLQSNPTGEGEGFAIVVIQCTLIEFLAALKEGKSYVRSAPKEHEYRNSSDLFCNFLHTQQPFKDCFSCKSKASEFYTNVRCALLHEAQTKDGWRIWDNYQRVIDTEKKIVGRNDLQNTILGYLEIYKNLLETDKCTQSAFLRKFDSITKQ